MEYWRHAGGGDDHAKHPELFSISSAARRACRRHHRVALDHACLHYFPGPRRCRRFYPVWCEKSICGIGLLCDTSVIVMEHATQQISPLDRTVPRCTSHQRYWTLLLNALMRSRVIVVVNIHRQYLVEMPLTED